MIASKRVGETLLAVASLLLVMSAGPATAALVVYEGFATSNGYVYDDALMPSRGICAHRGASHTHPENTLAAFAEAVKRGAHQIELDVRFTSDGQMVLMHDVTVDRTTNGTGAVADLTLAQIKSLDAGSWKGAAFAGEQVPTLAEALEVLPRNIWINVEIKGDAALAAAAAVEIARQKRTHQAFLACSTDEIDAARAAVPSIRICNMNRLDFKTQYVNDTIARGCDFIQLKNSVVSADDMARLKAAGVRVNYTSTDTPAELTRLYNAGVDFPLSNDVGPMVAAASSLGVAPFAPSHTSPAAPVTPDPNGYIANQTIRGVARDRVGFDGTWTASGSFKTHVDVCSRSKGLDYAGLQTAPGAIEVFRTDSSTTSAKSIQRRLRYHYDATDDVWVSFLFKYDGFEPSPEAGSPSNLEISLLGANSKDFTLRIDANGLGTIHAGGSAGSTINLGKLAPGTTHMLVVKAQGVARDQYDSLSVWLDPANPANLGPADHTGVGIVREQFAADKVNAFSNFRIRAMINPTGYSAVVDELRIGTSLDVDSTAEPIVKPSMN